MLRSALAILSVAFAVPGARAALTLELAADTEVRGETALSVRVRNVGDEPAEHLGVVATFRGAEAAGPPVPELPPGLGTAWELRLPPPPGPGTFPLVVHLRYDDAFGRALSAPLVHVVRTPGLAPPEVRLDLTAEALVDVGRMRARLENRGREALHGTFTVVPPGDLTIEPRAGPVDVPAGGVADVALFVRNAGALPGSAAPVYVYVELDRGGRHETVVAAAAIPILDAEAAGPLPWILAVGAGAALVAAATLAWRRAARRATRRSRAEQRRR